MEEKSNISVFDKKTLTDKDFKRLSDFIYSNYGIKMPYQKKVMLEGRLQKRLRHWGFKSFNEYCDFVFSEKGQEAEVIHMIDVVSTNKTDFFRESAHFDYMTNEILPLYKEKGVNQIDIWSSACSSGEEPYTIAMVMNEFNDNNKAYLKYNILCSDISTDILSKAKQGIYRLERIENIPLAMKRKYFLKSKDTQNPTVRVVPELRKKMSFTRLNLMDPKYNVPTKYDIIFCRNVLIYFDWETQEKVINKLCEQLKPGGYFFLGHSESAINKNVPLKQIRPTVFVRT
ncbi:MAG: protein-glutamate O-methyltransferase [Cyclobacteriaceae bacterium]|nr:protein-glutamate O-methyltransferase [Cyclobacteriaceae bacterium]